MSRDGRREGAGRPKGSTNKRSIEIGELLESIGVDPILGMAWIASNDKEALGIAEDVPISIRAQMFKELGSYIRRVWKSYLGRHGKRQGSRRKSTQMK